MSAPRDLDLEFAFSSGRSGTGPATWGQHAVWDVVRNLGADAARYNVSGGGAVDPGLPADRIVRALQELFPLNDSLRTTLHEDGEGRLVQQVHEAGSAALVVRRCEPEAVEHEADALLARLAAAPFDSEHEWPARFGAVESGGLVRHMVFVLSHTAVDAWGLRHLIEDMSALSHGGASGQQLRQRRADRLQPLEEAQYQASERGRRQDAAARRHWRGKLDLGPRRMFRPAAGPQPADVAAQPAKFPNAALDSPALALALHRISATHAVSSASVLLAAASAMVARLSGSADAVFQVVVNNRFLPGLQGAVSTVAQEGIFHLPDAADRFPQLLRRAFGSSLSAYRGAYYDKASLERDMAQLRGQRGDLCDLTCFVNDTRGVKPDRAGVRGPPADNASIEKLSIEMLRPQTTLRWPVEFEPRRNVSFALDVLDVPGSVGLSMTADSSLITRADMERFLYGVEDLVVTEALALG
jgi:hypothetical protein